MNRTTAFAAVLAATAIAIAGCGGTDKSSSDKPDTSSSAAACAAAKQSSMTITSPGDHTKIKDGNAWLLVTGKFCLRSGDYVWAFDQSDGGKYFLDQEGRPLYARDTAGNFTYGAQPIGDEGAKNQPTNIVFVAGNNNCSVNLLLLPHNKDGDVETSKIPADCYVMGTLHLIVTRK